MPKVFNIGDQPSFILGFLLFLRKIMMELKRPYTYDEQIDKMKSHDMILPDDNENTKNILSSISYYRITGYSLQFRKSANDSNYVKNTSFENILRIYTFDEKLRNILRCYIEKVEIFYRNQISYGFSISKCIQSPHDQHYDEKNYYKREEFKNIISHFEKDKDYYKDSLIVKHHKAKYNDKMPLWVMVELLSFSDVSKLYSCMYYSEQNKIANNLGISSATLINHLHCLSVLRNKCAHAARLYNTKFYPKARFNTQFLRTNKNVKSDTLFAYILVLIKRLPNNQERQTLINEIYNVINEYKNNIDLTLIGFPENYYELLNAQLSTKLQSVTISKQKTTVKKLKAKKKYYVRIRTYKTVKGKKVYSSWSGVKSVKTK